jgi:hypothetical protein
VRVVRREFVLLFAVRFFLKDDMLLYYFVIKINFKTFIHDVSSWSFPDFALFQEEKPSCSA